MELGLEEVIGKELEGVSMQNEKRKQLILSDFPILEVAIKIHCRLSFFYFFLFFTFEDLFAVCSARIGIDSAFSFGTL